jgi:hypothetical protein
VTAAPELGLCQDCVHARVVRSARGSVFLRCALSEHDPRFAKYPRLPVRSCAGHVPGRDRERDPPEKP